MEDLSLIEVKQLLVNRLQTQLEIMSAITSQMEHIHYKLDYMDKRIGLLEEKIKSIEDRPSTII